MPEIARNPKATPKAGDTPAKTKRESIKHEGRTYPIIREVTGTWRIRSRSKSHSIDAGLGTTDLSEAKRVAREMLEQQGKKKKPKGSETVKDTTEAYKTMSKRCSDEVATNNVGRLERIILATLKKTTDKLKLQETIGPKLWRDYMAKAQGLEKIDLNTRRPINAKINAAVRQAVSIFIPRLRPSYAELGIHIPDDACVVQWLPEVQTVPPTADVKNMDAGIRELKEMETHLWLCLGAARFAGMRRAEIKAFRREWVVEDRGRVLVELRDRPEDGFLTKTGQIYRSLVIDEGFAQALLAIPPGNFIVNVPGTDRDRWFEHVPQDWLKPYTGKARKPLHRLRGLYADDVKRITEEAIFAKEKGTKAASEALGHTSVTTTKNHYLSETEERV